MPVHCVIYYCMLACSSMLLRLMLRVRSSRKRLLSRDSSSLVDWTPLQAPWQRLHDREREPRQQQHLALQGNRASLAFQA